MPWKGCSVMDERLRFVARLLDGEAMSEVCRAFGISRKTGYKIFDHIWQQSGADKKGKGRRGARTPRWSKGDSNRRSLSRGSA